MLDGLGLAETTPGPLIMVSVRRLARRLEPSGAVPAPPGRHDWRFSHNMADEKLDPYRQ
jgi:hypothetical protein